MLPESSSRSPSGASAPVHDSSVTDSQIGSLSMLSEDSSRSPSGASSPVHDSSITDSGIESPSMLSEDSSRSPSGASTPVHDSSVTDSEIGEVMSLGHSASASLLGLHPAMSAQIQTNDIPTVRALCCVGAGYVGGPTAAVIALQNPHIRVTVVDMNATRIAQWNSRHLPVHEPGLCDVIRSARDGTRSTSFILEEGQNGPAQLPARAPNLFFTTNMKDSIAEADIVFLSVNTPTKTTGIGAGQATNTSALESATRTVAMYAKERAIIVEKSTVPCRTAQIIRDTLEVHRPGVPFEILSNPEFLAEGTAIKDLLHPDRILIGSLPTPSGLAAAAALRNVYASWVEPAKIVTVNLWSSELAKLVANAMLAQRISSINTISAICERTGADVEELAHTIGLDQRIGSKFLKAGIGFGGSCFKKDILSLIYLANSLELPEVGEYWMQVLKINEMQRVRFVRRIVQKLNGNLQGKKITILGYAFKKDTNDTRESPAIDVIKQLLADAPAEIAIFDPQCTPSLVETEVKQFFSGTYPKLLKTDGGPIAAYADAYNACHDSSAVIILTEWDQFRYPPLPVPNSAFHEGDVLRRNEQVKIKGHARNPNETLVLEIRERKQSISTPLSKSAGFFDPLARFENEPPCPGDCAQCLRSQSEDVIAHQTVDWIRIGYHMRKPRWVFDGRGVLDVHGMEKLGFRVESIGKAGTASKLNDFEYF